MLGEPRPLLPVCGTLPYIELLHSIEERKPKVVVTYYMSLYMCLAKEGRKIDMCRYRCAGYSQTEVLIGITKW